MAELKAVAGLLNCTECHLRSPSLPCGDRWSFFCLCARGVGSGPNNKQQWPLDSSLLPGICMAGACCPLENFSSLRKNRCLPCNLVGVGIWDLDAQGKQRARSKSPVGLLLHWGSGTGPACWAGRRTCPQVWHFRMVQVSRAVAFARWVCLSTSS